MILYCKTQPDKQSFVFQSIEGKDWKAEVQNAVSAKTDVIKEFYEKRAKLKLGVLSLAEVIANPASAGLKTQKELEGSASGEYEVSKIASGPDKKNTLFKILKDYFQTTVGVSDETEASKEAYLSLHILAQNGMRVDYIRNDETIEITNGKISVRRTLSNGKTRIVGKPISIRELEQTSADIGREPDLTPPVTPSQPSPAASPIEQRQGSTEKRKGSLDPD